MEPGSDRIGTRIGTFLLLAWEPLQQAIFPGMPSGSSHQHLALAAWFSAQSFPTDPRHSLYPHRSVHADFPAPWGGACPAFSLIHAWPWVEGAASRQGAQLLVLHTNNDPSWAHLLSLSLPTYAIE